MEVSETIEAAVRRFVPEMLVELISRNTHKGKTGIEPSSKFLQGVCLLVDISGFTKLSSQFCELGKSGIDDLQLATNSFMEKLVQIIYSSGGEIIKFAGDAIICLFSNSFMTNVSTKGKGKIGTLHRSISLGCMSDEASIVTGSVGPFSPGIVPVSSSGSVQFSVVGGGVSSDVILRAMHCASILRETQTDKLSVHVAISCGEMCFGILGGVDDRWECLVSGQCIQELSSCLDDANSKEAVISEDCAEILFHAALRPIKEEEEGDITPDPMRSITTEHGTYRFELCSLSSGNYRIGHMTGPPPIDEFDVIPRTDTVEFAEHMHPQILQLIRQFAPLPLMDEIESGRELNFIAEIREVSTMFMKWDSYDAEGKHRNLLELQDSFYATQEVLHASGAYLRQFLVDDKGCVLIACWGMPNMTYLDNAQRALSAAAQIRRNLNKLELTCSFGITTGDVYCGTVGSAVRMEYAAIGSVVNMAARLMGKANGSILIDDATFELLPQNMKDLMHALAPMTVKGRDTPLQAYSYVSVGKMKVKEKIVEDHEIAAACETALQVLLQQMKKAVSIEQKELAEESFRPHSMHEETAAPFKSLLNQSSSRRNSAISPPPLHMVLIQGKEGSGRTTVMRWLSKQAHDCRIPTYNVRVTQKDSSTDYFIWRRLFQLMTPKGMFLSNDAQRTYVKALLAEIYPGAFHTSLHIGYPVIKSVLGITCVYSSSHRARKSNWLSAKLVGERTIQNSDIQDVLFRVFKYLLTVQTSLLLIENIEHCDGCSLKTLMDLTKLNTASRIVLTALNSSNETESKSPKMSRSILGLRRSYRHSGMNNSPWAKLAVTLTRGHRSVEVITLANFTPGEIDRMLCAALNLSVIPPEVSQLVQDFSGGSHFWVREILQFITEYGVDQFLAAAEEDQTAQDSRRLLSDLEQHSFKNSFKTITQTVSFLSKKRSVSQSPCHKSAHFRQLSKSIDFRQTHQVHLDHLILCRFGGLTTDVQRILRTASIIGVFFSSTILSGVIPPRLCEQLDECVQILLNQRWIYQDPADSHLFQFAHIHSHQIIYELTPSSERSRTHQLIAEYMEMLYRDDKSQYALISFHYQHCNPDKAVLYAVEAIDFLLKVDSIYDFGDCLDLLTGLVESRRTCASTESLKDLVVAAITAVTTFECNRPTMGSMSLLWRGVSALSQWLVRSYHKEATVLPTHEPITAYTRNSTTSTTTPLASTTHTPNAITSPRIDSGNVCKPQPRLQQECERGRSAEEKAQEILLEALNELFYKLCNEDVAGSVGAAGNVSGNVGLAALEEQKS